MRRVPNSSCLQHSRKVAGKLAAGLPASADARDAILPRLALFVAYGSHQNGQSPIGLWHWLSRGVELGQIECEGAGHRTDPLRYWPPQREEVWKQDFLYELIERSGSS